MRLMLLAMVLLLVGCGHARERNLAQRQPSQPRGDFVAPAKSQRPGSAIPQSEPPIVTPVP
jgi:hypothetical protein